MTQTMKVVNMCGQEDFDAGAAAAFYAMKRIYEMDTKTRKILFGSKGLPALLEEDPKQIFDILDHEDEIMANYVEVGDVIAKDNDENFRDVVTYVYDNGMFDSIGISKNRYGRVCKGMSLKENHFHKTGECAVAYHFKQPQMSYSWE